ncbi:MAG TPA: C4-type zinc ribbon domain-containing protein [Myxococcota bacterium]|nr:C4-type zinc ribbon domain-containing protein [Myxococcota bacterium]
MLQGIQALLELSKVDVQIAELEDERRGLPAARAALHQEREKGQAAVEAAQSALLAAEQEQRRHEAAVADREALVKRLEGQQHQIKTNEAYTVLLHEIDVARAAISDAETKILEAMEGIESARAALDRARAAAKGTEDRAAQQQRAFDEREKSLDQTLGNLRREREALVGGVDVPLLQRYDRIAVRRRPAVAIADKGKCLGCHVSVPPQVVLELRRGVGLHTCGNCQRILVLADHA